MSLHRKQQHVRNGSISDAYATRAMNLSLPKDRIPAESLRPDVAFDVVYDQLMLDGNARQNLATFCQTWFDDEIHKLMDQSIDKNMIDKDEYPATAEIESYCVNMLGDLWHAASAATTVGCSTTGSSEAAMLGGLAMKWRWRARQARAKRPTDRPNLITGPVQVCWHKFARYFDVELREVPLERRRLGLTAEGVLTRVDENTIGVVTTLGVTFTCQYEPVVEIAAALDKLERDTGLNVPIHVDAASGGFIAPFVQPDLEWDFRIARVKSINTSGHKYGLAPLGVGWILWREACDLPDDLVFRVNYLGGDMPTFALNFSRPGGQIICQYYLMLRLGKEGYRLIHQACYDTARYLAQEIASIGPFEMFFDGDSRHGLPAVSWTLRAHAQAGYSLFDFSERLRARGWQVAAYPMLPEIEDVVVMRIVVRHGFSRHMAELLIDDIRRCIEYFDTHPVIRPMTASEGRTYNHDGARA